MRRFGLLLTAVCVAVLVCVVRLQSGGSTTAADQSDRAERGRQAESRYLQNEPRHWRSLLLQH